MGVKGRVHQECLQALGVHLEGHPWRHIQSVGLQHWQPPDEVVQQLHHSHMCLIELPCGTKHLPHLVLLLAGTEENLVVYLFKMPLVSASKFRSSLSNLCSFWVVR